MPLPIPNTDEKQSAFISRCMSSLDNEDSPMLQKQRVAACSAQWRNKRKYDKNHFWHPGYGSFLEDVPEMADPIVDEQVERDAYEPLDLLNPERAMTGQTEHGWHASLAGHYPEMDAKELPDNLKPGRLLPGEDEDLMYQP